MLPTLRPRSAPPLPASCLRLKHCTAKDRSPAGTNKREQGACARRASSPALIRLAKPTIARLRTCAARKVKRAVKAAVKKAKQAFHVQRHRVVDARATSHLVSDAGRAGILVRAGEVTRPCYPASHRACFGLRTGQAFGKESPTPLRTDFLPDIDSAGRSDRK